MRFGGHLCPSGGLFVPMRGHVELSGSGRCQLVLGPRGAEPVKGKPREDLADAGRRQFGVPQQPRGRRGITWEGDNLKTLVFALVSPPPRAPAPGTRPRCRWTPPDPSEGQDQAHGRALGTAQRSGPARGEIASSRMDPPSRPVNRHTPAEQGNGVPVPADPPRGSAPPEPAPATAFSGLSVLIFGCFLIKAIWGLRHAAESRGPAALN